MLFDLGAAASSPGTVIISVSLMLFMGFAMTRLTKLAKLPNVTAYILTGILIGPYCLKLIPDKVVGGMDFLPDIALAFIGFSVGEHFRVSTLKKSGARVVLITIFDTCAAFAAVFVLTYFILRLDLAFSVVLSALATATAPSSNVMTIRQTHSKGEFVETLLQVVAMDDFVGLMAYGVAISVALSLLGGSAAQTGFFRLVGQPVLTNIGILALGGFFGLLLKLFMRRKHTSDNCLIIAVGLLLAFCGICSLLNVSPIIGCMSMGAVYINTTGDERLFMQLNYFDPPILLLFFVRSGLSFQLGSLLSASGKLGGHSLLAVGLLFFAVRIAAKYAGAYAGCAVIGKPKLTRRYLGLALIPQAGVAIGLAAICARVLGGQIGADLQTVILASSILCELVGPACAKYALYRTGSFSDKLENLTAVEEKTPAGAPRAPVEVLIDRIRQIEAEQAAERKQPSEEERAFDQAAEEQAEEQYYEENASRFRQGRFLNR